MMSPNLKAFLDMIATSELGARLLLASDNGYNVLVGSTADHPRLFSSYADHPRQLIDLPRLGKKSTAAGRYQLLARYFDPYKQQLGLRDFSPASQDAIAVQQIRERKALVYAEAGRFDDAVARCAAIWASLPGAGYGQHENDLADLRRAYLKAGGQLA
ncbi:glycoside hydrolase family 104 protein [Massilia sp. 9096]|uniref:glycoside hydrolase family 24 protein n=1 Tax=Massilia sp. 9096 TaxID=1500894 RepID=UPI00055C8CC9|nr:glycoside hydrolase family 104 protein [Massilia sp. 9096]